MESRTTLNSVADYGMGLSKLLYVRKNTDEALLL